MSDNRKENKKEIDLELKDILLESFQIMFRDL